MAEPKDPIIEILERLTRIETRFERFMDLHDQMDDHNEKLGVLKSTQDQLQGGLNTVRYILGIAGLAEAGRWLFHR